MSPASLKSSFAVATVLLIAVLLIALSPSESAEPKSDFTVELQTAHSGYDRKTCWVHTRTGMIPGSVDGSGNPFSVVMTMHELRLTGSDVYYPIHDLRSDDGGRTST